MAEGRQEDAGVSKRAGSSSRAERDAARERRAQGRGAPPRSPASARRRRPTIDERPDAPWGNFPLTELMVLLAILLGVYGFIARGEQGRVALAAAAGVGSLAGLELSIREHFAGYRSHTTLLAGSAAVLTIVVLVVGGGSGGVAIGIVLGAALAVFGISFWALREAFKRRSGGLGFR